ncbi:MAG: hypothetical protein OQK51_08830 [Kangiellaceae bacterium]|nr:hypothetical protein [Kangiellaceae bacterium]
MLHELQNNQSYFFAFFAFSVVWVGVFMYWGKRKVDSLFLGIEKAEEIFREKQASGYSKKSIITRIGGARNALDVIVTDAELCIKGIFFPISVIGLFYDLTIRIKLNEINEVTLKGKEVEIAFRKNKGARSIVLQLKNPDIFIHAIKG